MTNLEVFQTLCSNLSQHDALHIPSPDHQKRRAAVAAIVRWRNGNQVTKTKVKSIPEFFKQDWVQEGEAEILFMKRTSREEDRWSGHVSFVGGKNEPGESDRETAEREVMEEIGVDLSGEDYIPIGKLDDREVTLWRDNGKLLMILAPFVYLQVVPESPQFKLQESEVADVNWVPLSFFLATQPYPPCSISEPWSVGYPLIRFFIPWIMASVSFPAVDLPGKDHFRLWGLTLGMTRDIIQFTQIDQLAFVSLVNTPPAGIPIYFYNLYTFVSKKLAQFL